MAKTVKISDDAHTQLKRISREFSPIDVGEWEAHAGMGQIVEALIADHYHRSGAADYFGAFSATSRTEGEEK